MSRRSIITKTLVLGLTALALIAVVVWYLGGRHHHPPLTVTAQFEDSVGLYEGNAVSVLGMPVGRVTEIAPKETYVEVTIVIDEHVDIPADVQAVTVSTSILTDRHIELTPPYRGGPTLTDGDIVSLARTRTPVEFDRTLAMADKLASALEGDGKGQGPLKDLIGLAPRSPRKADRKSKRRWINCLRHCGSAVTTGPPPRTTSVRSPRAWPN